MNQFNPTTKTQQAVSEAAQAATMAGNPDITPVHLLAALLAQGDGLTTPLLTAVGADPAQVRAELEKLAHTLPSATGASMPAPQLSRDGLRVITHAQRLATDMGDEYVSTEHLLVGLAAEGGQVADLLRRHGATPDSLREAFAKVRGSVTHVQETKMSLLARKNPLARFPFVFLTLTLCAILLSKKGNWRIAWIFSLIPSIKAPVSTIILISTFLTSSSSSTQRRAISRSPVLINLISAYTIPIFHIF